MRYILRALQVLIVCGSLSIPLFAFAAFGLPFGGRISVIIPCTNGALYVIVQSARLIDPLAPEPYIWTPATLTFLSGPPSHPGQEILGVATIPYVCLTTTVPSLPLPGLLMQIIGTSPL